MTVGRSEVLLPEKAQSALKTLFRQFWRFARGDREPTERRWTLSLSLGFLAELVMK
jgi:hypothetical protein